MDDENSSNKESKQSGTSLFCLPSGENDEGPDILRLSESMFGRVSTMRNKHAEWEKSHDSKLISIVHGTNEGPYGLTFLSSTQKISNSDSKYVLDILRSIDPHQNLDIILHTPGGSICHTEIIVKALLNHKGRIRVFVPYRACSGGTLIALCGHEIHLGKGAWLSPVDPQGGWLPAIGVLDYLEENTSTLWVTDLVKIAKQSSTQSLTRIKGLCQRILEQRQYAKEKSDEICDRILLSSEYQHDQTFTFDDLKYCLKSLENGVPEEVYLFVK